VEEAQVRSAVETAGVELWNPPHLAGRPVRVVKVDELVSLPTGWLAIGSADGVTIAAPIVDDGGVVRRARPGDGVAASLVDLLAGGGTDSIEVLYAAPTLPDGREERVIGVDQANESYVIGNALVLKLFPRTLHGAHPAVDVPAHLVAVGFDETPALLGALRLRGDLVIASLSTYIPGVRDGWEWYVDLVQRACLDGSWSDADVATADIGALVARLHRALAQPSPIVRDPTGEVDTDVLRSWHARTVRDLRAAVADTPGEAGERLRRLAPRARAILDRMLTVDRTSVQRIHGDLHVGQVLRNDRGTLWVSDFDGDPLTPAAPDPRDAPARDVAAMAGAIDHVGRVVARREPGAQASLADWIERARAAFLSAYRLELGDASPVYDERLLHPFAVAQEAHEYRYAASFIPGWGYVPDAAMPAAIARAEAGA
jgi:maltokinase